MARRLARHVALFDPKGNLRQFEPGDHPPAWAVKAITNPKAWESSSASDGAEPAGPNAGRDAWATYAASLDVDVTDDDKRDEIVAKIRDAGHPVE